MVPLICVRQVKLGMQTTGHAARGAGSPPSPSSTNLYMENGVFSAKDLIAGVKNGLYLKRNFLVWVSTILTVTLFNEAGGFWIEEW